MLKQNWNYFKCVLFLCQSIY